MQWGVGVPHPQAKALSADHFYGQFFPFFNLKRECVVLKKQEAEIHTPFFQQNVDIRTPGKMSRESPVCGKKCSFQE